MKETTVLAFGNFNESTSTEWSERRLLERNLLLRKRKYSESVCLSCLKTCLLRIVNEQRSEVALFTQNQRKTKSELEVKESFDLFLTHPYWVSLEMF